MTRFDSGSRIAGQIISYFGSSVVQAMLSVALIPLATMILGPKEFGAYGMAVVVAGLASASCDLGCGIVLYGHYSEASGDELRRLLASVLFLSTTAGLLFGSILFGVWPVISMLAGNGDLLSQLELSLICLSVPLRTFTSVATQIFVMQSRAIQSGLTVLAQSLGTFMVTLVALFVWNQGQTALFWGNVAGLTAGVALAIFLLRTDYHVLPSRAWMIRMLRAAPSALSASVLENLRSVVESTVMVRGAGLTGVGLYNHARLYHGFLMQMSNAFAYALWPKALEEARVSSGGFERIGRAWNVVYLGLTMTGIGLALFGQEVVQILTNGKFIEAAPWIPFWAAYLLVQNSGKPATAVLYAGQQGAKVSQYRAGTVLCALVGLVGFVPVYGIPAAMAVAFLEMLMFRWLLQRAARRFRKIPFQDEWVIGGCVGIALVTGAVYFVGLSLGARAVFFVFSTACLLLAGRSIVADAMAQVYGFFLQRTSVSAS